MYPLADISRPAIARAREQHHRAADLHLVAAGEFFLINARIVDKRAVGTAQIDNHKLFAQAANFRMATGNFGIVQLHSIDGVAAQVNRAPLGVQFVSDPLIPTLNHKQGCHERAARKAKDASYAATRQERLRSNSSILRTSGL